MTVRVSHNACPGRAGYRLIRLIKNPYIAYNESMPDKEAKPFVRKGMISVRKMLTLQRALCIILEL